MARRFHILSGHFDSFEAAQIYCYDTASANDPEQINLDQDQASIDADYIEIGFKDDIMAFLRTIFADPVATELAAFISPSNTVISIDHAGLWGGDAKLTTNATLRYLGLFHETAHA